MASVALLPSSAEASLDVLVELSAAGMVGEVYVVREDLRAQWLEAGTLVDVELFNHLAERKVSIVRIVRIALDGSALDARHRDVAEQLAQAYRPIGVAVERGSIVVPADGVTVSADAFEPYWNYNVIVEPVDAAGERGFVAVTLDSGQRQAAVAANVLCVALGLWKWLEASPFDGGAFRRKASGEAVASSDGTGTTKRVRLARVTTRVIDAGDVMGQAVAAALSPGAQLPPPVGCVAHGDPAGVIDQVVHALVPPASASPIGFSYVPLEPLPAQPKTEIGAWEAIKQFATECLDELKAAPREALQRRLKIIRDRVREAVQNNTYGADSALSVQFGNPPEASFALDPAKRSSAVSTLPFVNAKSIVETPQTWLMLQQIVLALADGGELPDKPPISAVRWNGSRGVLADRSLLASPTLVGPMGGGLQLDADDVAVLGWEFQEDLVLAGNDVFGADALQRRLENQRLERTAESDAAGSGTVEVADDASSPDEAPTAEAFPPPSEAPQSGPTSETEGPGPEASAAEFDTAGTGTTEIDEPEVGVDEPDAASFEKRLRAWRGERERTLLWRLAASLSLQQQRALDDLSTTSERLEALEARLGSALADEAARRKRFRIWGLLTVLGLIGGLALGAVGIAASFLFGPIIWLGVCLLTVLGAAWAMIVGARRRVRQRHLALELESLPAHLSERRQTAADEYARLSALYSQFLDWSQIIAIALHRPFGDGQQVAVEPWATEVGALSFISASPRLDSGAMANASLRVAQAIASPGWLSRAYDRQRGQIVNEYFELTGGVGAAASTPEADFGDDQAAVARVQVSADQPETVVYRPRMNLLLSMRSGGAADRYRSERFEELRLVAHGGALNMIETVTCDVVGLNDPPRDAAEFLLPIVEWDGVPTFQSSLTATRALEGVELLSMVGITPGVQSPDAGQLRREEVSIAILEPADRLALAAIRLDITDAMEVGDIALIGSAASQTGNAGPSSHHAGSSTADPTDDPGFG